MILGYAWSNFTVLNLVNVKLTYFSNEPFDLLIRSNKTLSNTLLEAVSYTHLDVYKRQEQHRIDYRISGNCTGRQSDYHSSNELHIWPVYYPDSFVCRRFYYINRSYADGQKVLVLVKGAEGYNLWRRSIYL